MNEDDFIYWQDVLEAVQAGRTGGVKCPFCYQESLSVVREDRKTRIQCATRNCRNFIEGRFSAEDVSE